MMYSLEIPDQLAGLGVQRQEAIREEVIAYSLLACEVASRRTGRHVDDAPLLIDSHARPVVRSARVGPSVLRPRLVAFFAGMRNRMELPAQCAGANIEGADIARWRGQRLGVTS